MGQLNANDGVVLPTYGIVETVVVTERLHQYVRVLLRMYPGAEVYYRSGGHEALVLTGGVIISVRDDGLTSEAVHHDEWSQYRELR